MSEPGPPPPPSQQESLVEALPAIARVAAGAWLRVTVWSLETSMRMGTRLARAAADPGAASVLAQDVSSGLRAYAREFLGIADLDDRVKQISPATDARGRRNGRLASALQEQGAELLRAAADVTYEDATHPAYAGILTELAPDEGRILRLLALEGPQPMVDVRAGNLIGLGSQLIEPNLNMVGAQAGVRRRDRVAAYLNNLVRLGLVTLSPEPLRDPIAYQVLEAQPEVLQAIKQTARTKTDQRSIRLTPFGADFCEVCLPLGEEAAGSGSETDPRAADPRAG
ncbi:MAG: DUF4393 domain-containing protein [Solirubrobacteraceae bacterium]